MDQNGRACLAFAHEVMVADSDAATAVGLTSNQVALLRNIQSNGDAGIKVMAENAMVSQPAMTCAVQALERKGLCRVIRRESTSGRLTVVSLTESAHQAVARWASKFCETVSHLPGLDLVAFVDVREPDYWSRAAAAGSGSDRRASR